MGARWLPRSIALAMIAGGAAFGYWLHVVQDVDVSPDGLRAWVAGLGAVGPALVVGVMALRPFVGLPSWVILAVAGLLFGLVWGTLYGALGGVIGALLAFFVARVLGREAVQSRLGASLVRFDGYLQERGAGWLAVYIALPISLLTPVFFAAGVTGLRAGAFTTAAALGFLPRAGTYAFLGQTLAEPSRENLLWMSAIVVVSGLAIWLARRYLLPKRATADARVD